MELYLEEKMEKSYQKALKKIREVKENKLDKLDLMDYDLSILPKEIFELKQLKSKWLRLHQQ